MHINILYLSNTMDILTTPSARCLTGGVGRKLKHLVVSAFLPLSFRDVQLRDLERHGTMIGVDESLSNVNPSVLDEVEFDIFLSVVGLLLPTNELFTKVLSAFLEILLPLLANFTDFGSTATFVSSVLWECCLLGRFLARRFGTTSSLGY